MNVRYNVSQLIKDFDGVTRLKRSLCDFKKSKNNFQKVSINMINHWRLRGSISNENMMWITLLARSKRFSTYKLEHFKYENYIMMESDDDKRNKTT